MAIGFRPGRGRGRTNKVQARIEGLERLQTRFAAMPAKTDSLMTREIHRAAERIAERANRDVPIDTGRLNRSIHVGKTNKGATVHVDAKYAGFVEFGTRKMSAQPYIMKHVQPSIDVLMKNILRNL